MVFALGKGGVLPDGEAGYGYDWARQRGSKKEADKEKYRKLKKKIDKL